MYKWADGREMRMDIQWESSLCHTCTLGYAQGTNFLLGDPSWHKDRSDVPLLQHKCPDQHAIAIYGSRIQFGNKHGTLLFCSWQVLNLHHAFPLSNYRRSLQKALRLHLRKYSELCRPCQVQMCGSCDVPDGVRNAAFLRNRFTTSEDRLRQQWHCWQFLVIPGAAERPKNDSSVQTGANVPALSGHAPASCSSKNKQTNKMVPKRRERYSQDWRVTVQFLNSQTWHLNK